MKHSPSSLLLASLLAACTHTAARSTVLEPSASAPSNPAPKEVVIELPGDAEHPASLQTLVKVSQKASGWNFTYTQETADALRARSMEPIGQKRVPAAEFPAFFEALLAANGFHCEPIGPERLRVLLISTRKG